MANFHSRSNSLPSQSHPVMECVGDHLRRLKSSEAASISITSLCSKFSNLKELHECINNMIKMPSFRQALLHEECESWINELLEGSLRLVDLCGSSRDIVYLTKESIQDLESSIRRNKVETVAAVDIDAYVTSRKKINKMVTKCIKNMKSFNQSSTAIPDRDYDLKAIGTMLRETESLDLSVLNSVLLFLSGKKERSSKRSRSFLSRLIQTSRVYSETEEESGAEDLCLLNIQKSRNGTDSMTVKNMLKQSEMIIQELEEGLESLFRNLVKTRVSLLNVLSSLSLCLMSSFVVLTKQMHTYVNNINNDILLSCDQRTSAKLSVALFLS